MRHLKHHAMHLLMCAPMLVIGIALIASGSGVGVLLPLAACMLMMSVMMGGMHGGSHEGHNHDSDTDRR